ncbi:MAG: histidinol-phosphatase HisJ family protein [Bacillota bacterium]|nr:histidinol-phosphatase HisJ family protein [Bacillota bacterium]
MAALRLPPDYHLHTGRCGHAAGSVRDYALRAREMGLAEIGFADHIYMYWLPREERDPSLAMAEEELPAYVEEVFSVRREFPDLTIRLGIEADYIPGREEELRRILEAHPFDYVIGAVHYIDGWGFDNPDQAGGYEGRDPDALYQEYFKLVQKAARSGLFDILAHPDLIKKFGCRSAGDLTGLYHGTACTCNAFNVAVEVNTAGLRAPVREIYPARAFLAFCLEQEVPVVLGSDAHRPDLVGADFDKAAALLRAVGYQDVAVFNSRQRKTITL